MFPDKWKNAKAERLEDEENEQILKKIMESPSKDTLKALVNDIEEYEKDELDNVKKGEDQFNTVCWLWNIRHCACDEPVERFDATNPDEQFSKEKHLNYLNRKYII